MQTHAAGEKATNRGKNEEVSMQQEKRQQTEERMKKWNNNVMQSLLLDLCLSSVSVDLL